MMAPHALAAAPDAAGALPGIAELRQAAALVHQTIPPTPQYRWPLLDRRCGAEVWVKHENHTPLGAFKARSALVYVARLSESLRPGTTLIAATRGNHGQAVAFAAGRYGFSATVVVPRGNSVEKNAAMRALGADLVEYGDDYQEAFEYAAEQAQARGWHRVPGFHPLLVQGAGTYALELLQAVPSLETIYVPIGSGSGVCGVMAARDALGSSAEVVGVVSESAPAYALSFQRRELVPAEVTTRIADGMACRVPVPEAMDAIWSGVERIVTVSDDEVESAMRALFADTHNVAEGGGAAAVAALLKERERMRGRRVAVVLSGGNVDTATYARVLQGAGAVDPGTREVQQRA